jgi:hypothetical protein
MATNHHLNLYELAKAPNYSGGRFVHDDRAVSNIIYGYEKIFRRSTKRIAGIIVPNAPSSG